MRGNLAIRVWVGAMALPAAVAAREAPGAKWLVAPAADPPSSTPPVAALSELTLPAPVLPGFVPEGAPDPQLIGIAFAVLGLGGGVFLLGRLIGIARTCGLLAGGRRGRCDDPFSRLSADTDRD
ncbi:hypothetical protein NHN26_16435 [Rhodovulum tesquicola]|uniref:hypothetical protein n=1 Tax=Rhodovulum tesquicola TaxID=540254 RepID=UPI002097ECE9|nr:hypothetical protein [Rhodovulum tesquicola]MCO8146797.1 hypothetical protein [Rhodovulum tesquicola]